MATPDVDVQLHTMLFNRQQGRRQFTGDRTLRQLHPLFFTHCDIAAIVNSAVWVKALQGTD
ncbi:hypothetical protein D3C72_1304780 [compost metagenome]